jgi:RNA polymerase sigma-32 factor
MEQRLSGSDLSVHTPINDDSDGDLLSILPSQNSTAEELLAEKEGQELVKKHFDEFAKSLNEKELAIFHGRLLSEEKMTLQELSDKFGISKERIRQIEERLIDKLKTFMQSKMESNIL